MGKAVAVTRREFTPAQLRAAACASEEPAQVRRLLAIALVLEGVQRQQAAEQCGMDRQTLRDWVHRYNEGGVAGLRSRPCPGRAPLLTPEQKAELKALVVAGPDPEREGGSMALRRPTRRGRTPVWGRGARGHDWRMAASAWPDAAAAAAAPPEEGRCDAGGI